MGSAVAESPLIIVRGFAVSGDAQVVPDGQGPLERGGECQGGEVDIVLQGKFEHGSEGGLPVLEEWVDG